jgi:hypothetical protein
MKRRALLATVPTSLIGVAGCLGGQSTNPSTKSHFDITNQRDNKIELSVRLKFGQDAKADSTLNITNERDNELEVSTRMKDGNRSFAVGDFVLDKGKTKEFTARFVNMEDVPGMSIAAKILSLQETTYEQEEIPVGVPEYDIRIQSDGIDVVWAEN